MIGFLAAVGDLMDPDAFRGAVEDSVPKGTETLNLKAFDTGYQYGIDILKRRQAGEEPCKS